MTKKTIKECFYNSPYKSIKHKSYFATYENLFSRFIGKEIVFVEIGVLNGGSLFMWREYFGNQARIVGIDNNPEAMRWKEHGFEIYIGDQSDINFWKSIASKLGKIDILLDDGGHLDYQQSVTLFENINNIKDNGLIVIEDTHSSYMKEFGNPSEYSFMKVVFNLIDKLNYRATHLKKNNSFLKLPISDIHIFESIVCFKINHENSNVSEEIINNGKDLNVKDFRHNDTERKELNKNIKKISFIKKIPLIGPLFNFIYVSILREKIYSFFLKKNKKRNIKKFF